MTCDLDMFLWDSEIHPVKLSIPSLTCNDYPIIYILNIYLGGGGKHDKNIKSFLFHEGQKMQKWSEFLNQEKEMTRMVSSYQQSAGQNKIKIKKYHNVAKTVSVISLETISDCWWKLHSTIFHSYTFGGLRKDPHNMSLNTLNTNILW